MRAHLVLVLYIALAALCLVLPYLLHVRPRRLRDWRLITVTLAFLTWLLLGLASLISW